MVTRTEALETWDHKFEFQLMIRYVSVFFCIMFPYVDTTHTGGSKMMDLVSRRNNFNDKRDTEIEFSVTSCTTHTFQIYIRRAQRSDRYYPVHTWALLGVVP